MTHFKTIVAVTAAAVFTALGQIVSAQDDLDDLLADLEGETADSKAAEKPEAPAAQEAAGKAPAPAEEKSEEEAAEPDEPADADDADEVDDVDDADEPVKADEPAAAPEAAAPEKPAAEADGKPAEAPAAAVAGVPAEKLASNDEVDEVLDLLSELAAESGEAPTVRASGQASAADDDEDSAIVDDRVEKGAAARKGKIEKPFTGPDAELLENIRTTEKLRREAMDVQAMREIEEARQCMRTGEYTEAVRHYGLAAKLLNDRPSSKDLRRECTSGIADGLYRNALEEYRTGRRERAIKLMEKAMDLRHPRARKQLETWLNTEDPDRYKTDVSEISHRRNEKSYKERRLREKAHLKRARQHLAQREIDQALEECELVLVGDPYNQEAIRLRDSIQRKRDVILLQEREVTRKAMIADVDEAWRPVYAVDAKELRDTKGRTVMTDPAKGDPERTTEQTIIKRMKEMRLPAISFKPPATIIDAVDYFRTASRDFDRPEIPLEQRGFNFVLKNPETVRMNAPAAAGEDNDDFSETADSDAGGGSVVGVPVIPMISASDISFYDALKLVCESVDYKFTVQNSIVMVMQKDMVTEELVTRSFPVLSSFTDKMGSASEDISQMKSTTAFGGGSRTLDARSNDGEENQERDWKQFFSLLGVKWPDGSSIFYVKTVGRLFVKNTLDNLAEFENVLLSLNQQVTLVEIETRFVEVCQDDLNSLGFEWILNSDYSLGVNRHVAKALGLKTGGWSATSGSGSSTTTSSTTTTTTQENIGGILGPQKTITESSSSTVTTSTGSPTSGRGWRRQSGSDYAGVNSFGGNSQYGHTSRYLSDVGNHISGESKSTNDQFMKVNAFLGQADVSMILHMLAQRSDTDLLSAPKVLTSPGKEATMKVVTEYIYPTDYDVQLQSSSSGGNGNGSSSQSAILAVVEPQSFQTREVGVILQVTPTLTDDGNVVDLELNTQVVDEPTWKNYGMRIPFTGNSSLQSFDGIGTIFTGLSSIITSLGGTLTDSVKQTILDKATDTAMSTMDNLSKGDSITYYDAPMEQPFFHVRSVESKVSVYPGATIVMGGLITEARKAMDDKVPFLGDIPYIGRLFRSHSEQTSKRNLLIFVTTRIVDGRGREMNSDGFDALAGNEEVKAAPEPETK